MPTTEPVPLTQAIRALHAGDGGKSLVEAMDAAMARYAARVLRELSPSLCSWCRSGIGGPLYEIPETGVWVHREYFAADDYEETTCYASPLHERAVILENGAAGIVQ